MEIIEFFVGLAEAISNWRSSMMFVIGLLFAFITTVVLGTDLPAIILAVIVFGVFFGWGLIWQDRYDSRRVR